MFRSHRVWILIPLLTLIAGIAATRYHEQRKLADFAEHDRGLLFVAGALDPDTISQLIEIHQFRTVVHLVEADTPADDTYRDEQTAVEQAGANFLAESLVQSSAVDDPSVARQIALLQNPDNYPILVHSAAGVERTAKFVVTYDLLFRGMPANSALELQASRLGAAEEAAADLSAFANNLERQHKELYPTASADNLKILR